MESGRTNTSHQTDADAIIEAAQDAVAQTRVVEPGEILASPAILVFQDTEGYGPNPRAKRGTVILHTAASLVQYVKDHQDDATVLYADVQARKVVAVFNDHAPSDAGLAGWRDHRAELHLRSTPEWERWIKRDGEIGSQVKFAEHIEDCVEDITDPSGSEMLELAQSIQATEKVQFRQAERLTDGQKNFVYDQAVETKAGLDGRLTVPDTFQIAIAPFEGGPRYPVTARLRTRLAPPNLTIGYALEGVEEILRFAFDELLSGGPEGATAAQSIETLTGLTALRGHAPNPLR